MRLLKSNYHQQCAIWAGFLHRICFWGKPSGVSRRYLWLTLAGRWTEERKKGNTKKSDRDLCSRGEHSALRTLLPFQQGNYLSKTTGQKWKSTKAMGPFSPEEAVGQEVAQWHCPGPCPCVQQPLCQPLPRLPTRNHTLAQTGMRGAATQRNN